MGVLPSGNSVYIGGKFTTVNGIARPRLVKVDATTGVVDQTFNANIKSGQVSELAMVNGRLIVGGSFAKKLMALNPGTGADTGYINLPITGTVGTGAGATEVLRFSVDPSGTHLVAVGNFTSVGGAARSRVFMLDLGADSASLASWYYQPFQNNCRAGGALLEYVHDVDFSPDGSYFVVAATGYIPNSGGLFATSATRLLGSRPTSPARPVRPGSTTPAATRCTPSSSPAGPSTSKVTSAGWTTRSATTSPAPAPRAERGLPR